MAYYNLQQSGLGRRFLDSLIEGLNRISAHPKMYREIVGKDVHDKKLPDYPLRFRLDLVVID